MDETKTDESEVEGWEVGSDDSEPDLIIDESAADSDYSDVGNARDDTEKDEHEVRKRFERDVLYYLPDCERFRSN